MSDRTCDLCHAEGPDMRTLGMFCCYQMNEIIPEMTNNQGHTKQEYRMTVCKNCRGELLDSMAEWRRLAISRRAIDKDSDGEPLSSTNPDANIPVRVSGRNILMTRDEYDDYCREGRGQKEY